MKPLSDLKISPAPWRIVDSYQFPEHGEWISVIKASNSKTVSVPTFYNARLIAAAPKLYDLAYRVLSECDRIIDHDGETAVIRTCSADRLECAMIELRAALADAAGEEVDDGE